MSRRNKSAKSQSSAWTSDGLQTPVLAVFRGIGQVFFQENALTGALFVLGIAVSSPLMAMGAVAGSIIGTITAKLLRFNDSEIVAGIYGFNSALVGIATLFFFQPGPASVVTIVVGSIVAAVVTWWMRKFLPFPTYTTPFILTTWVIYFLGLAMGMTQVNSGGPPAAVGFVEAAAKGVGQVMFQGNIWTGILFLIGIAVSNWAHALWVLAGSIVGALVCLYHHASVEEVAAIGIFGYNATLAAVALYLARKSLIPPLLGILISVPLIELFSLVGLPALTAPFVVATWIVLGLGWLERRLFIS